MKTINYIFLIIGLLVVAGCRYGDLNENPNEPTEVPEILLLSGTMLADVSINSSHINRISGMWSGQYKGEILLYESIYNYVISSEESNGSWAYLYNGIMAQNDIIQAAMSDNDLIMGITKVVEAHAVGTAAANWGDVPYSEAANEDIDDPKFDKQADVFAEMQGLLDEAITHFNNTDGYTLTQDIFFNGDSDKWMQTAYTLKARYYMLTKQYDLAYGAALNGISSSAASMQFWPVVGDDGAGIRGGSNLLWAFGTDRDGYMGTEGTYLAELIDETTPICRNNSKTYEEARSNYYYINPDGSEQGVGAQHAPMPLVTYQENLLTLAETAARTTSSSDALGYLNDLRFFLASGDAFSRVNSTDSLQYDAYDAMDFAAGGMENMDNIDETQALLREIIEERYVSGFGTFMPWNDARRLRKSDNNIAVPFPLNTTSVSTHPERFIISQDELNSNGNAPSGLSIFDVVGVNE